MHIRIFNPWEFRKEKKEATFKSQESMNCRHRTDDVVASSNSDVTRKAVCEPDEDRLVARKRLMPTEQSLTYLVKNSRKLWKAYKGFISLIAVYLAIIVSIVGGLTKIIRCERKSIVGNSKEFVSSERLRNVSSPLLFSIFHKCLNAVLSFRKELWHCDILYSSWERNKLDTKEKKELWSFGIRPILAKTGLRNLQLGNIVKGTFGRRSGNTVETFLAGKCYEIYLRLFSDLCASCHVKLRSYTVNLNLVMGSRLFMVVYIYIYTICIVICYPASGHRTLGLSQLKRILWFIFHQKQVF